MLGAATWTLTWWSWRDGVTSPCIAPVPSAGQQQAPDCNCVLNVACCSGRVL